MKTIRYTLLCLFPAVSLLMPMGALAAGICPEPLTIGGHEQTTGIPLPPPGGWQVTNGAWDQTSKFATVFWLGQFSPPRINCSYFSGLSLQRQQMVPQSPAGMGNWRCVSKTYCMCSGAASDCPLPGV